MNSPILVFRPSSGGASHTGTSPGDAFPNLQDGLINTETLSTIEHQAHVRFLLGNIGRDIETGVNLEFIPPLRRQWEALPPSDVLS